MTRANINQAIYDCKEIIYLAIKDILLQEYDGSIELNLILAPTEVGGEGEKITKVFIDYEHYSNGDKVDYVAVISNGDTFSLCEFDLTDMILIANQL